MITYSTQVLRQSKGSSKFVLQDKIAMSAPANVTIMPADRHSHMLVLVSEATQSIFYWLRGKALMKYCEN